MKRREFLNNSVVAGTAALLTPAAALADTAVGTSAQPSAAPAPAAAARKHSREWFEKRLKSRFLLESNDGRTVETVLVAVQDRGRTDRLDQFSLVFQAPDGADAHGLRWITHAEGRFQLALEAPYHIGHEQMHEAHFSLLL